MEQDEEVEDNSALETYQHHHSECCDIVVDPFDLFTLMLYIAAATFFLRTAITMNVVRKRKRSNFGSSVILHGN